MRAIVHHNDQYTDRNPQNASRCMPSNRSARETREQRTRSHVTMIGKAPANSTCSSISAQCHEQPQTTQWRRISLAHSFFRRQQAPRHHFSTKRALLSRYPCHCAELLLLVYVNIRPKTGPPTVAIRQRAVLLQTKTNRAMIMLRKGLAPHPRPKAPNLGEATCGGGLRHYRQKPAIKRQFPPRSR